MLIAFFFVFRKNYISSHVHFEVKRICFIFKSTVFKVVGVPQLNLQFCFVAPRVCCANRDCNKKTIISLHFYPKFKKSLACAFVFVFVSHGRS